MKVECRYCSKVLDEKDVFMDTDQNGKFYFFCDQEHRDKFEHRMAELALEMNVIMNPFFGLVMMGAWIKNKFKNKKRNNNGI